MIKLDFGGVRDIDKLGKLGVWLRRRRLEWLGVGLTQARFRLAANYQRGR
jgi:hypothetical protein